MLGSFLDAEDRAIVCLEVLKGQRAALKPSAARQPEEPLVTVSQYVDPSDGSRWYDFKVPGLPGSMVGIRESERIEEELIPIKKDAVILRVQEEAFLPNVPLEGNTYLATPGFIIYPPKGESYIVESPPITISVPPAIIRLGEEGTQAQQIVYQKGEPHVVIVDGTVDPLHCAVTLEGESIPVYEGGVFTYIYRFDLSDFEWAEDGEKELVLHLTATCPGYATARGTVRIVMQPDRALNRGG